MFLLALFLLSVAAEDCKLDKVEGAVLSGGGYNIRTKSLEHCIQQCRDWKTYVDTQCETCDAWASYVDFECKAVSYMIFAGGAKRCGLHRVTRKERPIQKRREPGWVYVGFDCSPTDLTCFASSKGYMREKMFRATRNRTLDECKTDCLEANGPTCKSFSYYPERKDCVLNSVSKEEEPELFVSEVTGMDVMYYGNNCK